MFSIAADNGKTSKLANIIKKTNHVSILFLSSPSRSPPVLNVTLIKINSHVSQKKFQTLHQFQSSSRKSAILSAAKKAKLKSNPSRVGEIF